jgi:hypothetical protein
MVWTKSKVMVSSSLARQTQIGQDVQLTGRALQSVVLGWDQQFFHGST